MIQSPLQKSRRVLAHRVVLGDTVHPMAVVSLTDDDSGAFGVEVMPFAGEIHSTSFHSGTVVVRRADGELWRTPDDGRPYLSLE